MKFENTHVYNFEGALRGMRNPKDSWDQSDSFFGLINLNYEGAYPEHDANDVAQCWINKFHPDLNWPEEFTKEGSELEDAYIQKLVQNGTLKDDMQQNVAEIAFIGPKDMKLAQTLIKAGPEHRKFLRQIFVSVDITAPLYWY